MEQIIVISPDAQFTWTQTDDGSWKETFIRRYDHEDGSEEWETIHEVHGLSTEDVEAFATQLQETGFYLYVA